MLKIIIQHKKPIKNCYLKFFENILNRSEGNDFFISNKFNQKAYGQN